MRSAAKYPFAPTKSETVTCRIQRRGIGSMPPPSFLLRLERAAWATQRLGAAWDRVPSQLQGGSRRTSRYRKNLGCDSMPPSPNLLNHPNFAAPSTVVGTPAFGVTSSVQTQENAGNRVGQLSLRIDF